MTYLSREKSYSPEPGGNGEVSDPLTKSWSGSGIGGDSEGGTSEAGVGGAFVSRHKEHWDMSMETAAGHQIALK